MNLDKMANQGQEIMQQHRRIDIPLSDFLEVRTQTIKNILAADPTPESMLKATKEELFNVMSYMRTVGVAQGYRACKIDQGKKERQDPTNIKAKDFCNLYLMPLLHATYPNIKIIECVRIKKDTEYLKIIDNQEKEIKLSIVGMNNKEIVKAAVCALEQ